MSQIDESTTRQPSEPPCPNCGSTDKFHFTGENGCLTPTPPLASNERPSPSTHSATWVQGDDCYAPFHISCPECQKLADDANGRQFDWEMASNPATTQPEDARTWLTRVHPDFVMTDGECCVMNEFASHVTATLNAELDRRTTQLTGDLRASNADYNSEKQLRVQAEKERDTWKEKYERCEWAKGVVQSAAGDALPWMQDGPIWKERAESAESRNTQLEEIVRENLEAFSLAGKELDRVPAQGYRGWREAVAAIESAISRSRSLMEKKGQ